MTRTPDRECLWCGTDLDQVGRPARAVWCSKSCRNQASHWRVQHRRFVRASTRIHHRPRRRLWKTPRSANPSTRASA